MEFFVLYNDIIFIISFSAFLGSLIQSIKSKSWVWLQYALLLALVAYGWFGLPFKIGSQLVLILLILFYLIPIILLWLNNKFVYKGKYKQAQITALLLGILVPLSDFRITTKYYKGVQKLEDGYINEGKALIREVITAKHSFSRLADISLHTLLCDYDWIIQEVTLKDIQRYPQSLEMKVRALGETGQLDALVKECFQFKDKLASDRLWVHNQSLMILAAYCGSSHLWQISAPKILKQLRPFTQEYWQNTLRYVQNQDENAYQNALECLSKQAPGLYQSSLDYRLTQAKIGKAAYPLSPEGNALLSELEQYFLSHEGFVRRSQKTVPLITLGLLLGNLLVYFLIIMSHLPYFESRYHYGALIYPFSLIRGDWMRFVTANFVHANWTHLLLNIMAFFYFPFVEKTLGKGRLLLIYLLSGIGSFLLGFIFMNYLQFQDSPVLVLGASASIFGVLGCILGISFNSWQGEGLHIAKRTAIAMFLIAVAQSVFDFFFLKGSIWFHLLGFLIGLSLFMLLNLWDERRHITKKFALVGLSWAVFFVFAGLKASYDSQHKEPMSDKGALMAAYISELAKEEASAAKWYLISAEKGNVDAQAQIAYRFQTGKGVQADGKKASYWLSKAANQGHTWAQSTLANNYLTGTGVPVDQKKAFYWYTKAALQDDGYAQQRLAVAYHFGLGTNKNPEEAYYWCSKAILNPENKEIKKSLTRLKNEIQAHLSPEALKKVQNRFLDDEKEEFIEL